MKYTHLVQRPAANSSATTIGRILGQFCSEIRCDFLRAAMAYVTVSGMRSLLDLLDPSPPRQSQWLIGLDDAISQPGAIELCKNLARSEVMVASFAESAHRFHLKILYLLSSAAPNNAIMMIGSANLTQHGLAGNAEAVVFLLAEDKKDRAELDGLWTEIWQLGRTISAQELETYTKQYEQNKKRREADKRSHRRNKSQKLRKRLVTAVLGDDNAEIDPSLASTCWIECGYITAMGRELEFKAEQGIYFALNPKGGPSHVIDLIVSDGSLVSLRMKYQGNHMWRLQMNNDVPEVAGGLRPQLANGKLGRSPWVAVFERTNMENTYTLRFVGIKSKEHAKLKRESARKGTAGRTSAREYGWY